MLISPAWQTASPNWQVLDQRKTFLKKLMWNVPEEEELRGPLTSIYTHPPTHTQRTHIHKASR